MLVESNNNNSSQQHCSHCGKREDDLLVCSRCHSVAYCSKTCQKKNWKVIHKQVCGTTMTNAGGGNSNNSSMTASDGSATTVDNLENHGLVVSSSPHALYRTTVPGGVEWFMGIVGYGGVERLVKLNDPAGELDGPGHDMCDAEFFTECFHYGGTRANYPPEFPPIKTISPFLRDFANKPADFIDTQEDQFDIKYPHGISNAHNRRHVGPTPQIRFGDCVRVMVERAVPFLPVTVKERFWAEVISITAFGMVTAISINTLDQIHVREDDFVAFPVTRIVGVEHGPNWP